MNDPGERIEDSLADAIANLWQDISDKAENDKTVEKRKDEELILTWAGKLAEILKGPKK